MFLCLLHKQLIIYFVSENMVVKFSQWIFLNGPKVPAHQHETHLWKDSLDVCQTKQKIKNKKKRNTMENSILEKNIVPQLGVSELWLVAFHAVTSPLSLLVPTAPFRDSTTPFTAQRFPLPPWVPLPVHFVKRIWSRESQNNVQWTLLCHPWSGYEEKGIWVNGGKKGRRGRAGILFARGRKKKKGRCMLIEFSAGGGRDASTKNPQTDQDGRPSPQKKRTLIITTFFRTKLLVFLSPRMATRPRGDPLYRPTASLSHFWPPSLTRSSESSFTIEFFRIRLDIWKPSTLAQAFLSPSFGKLEGATGWITSAAAEWPADVRGLTGKRWPRFKCW